MRVVIMGSGRTGSVLAAQLDDAQHEVTIIDPNQQAFNRLPDGFSGNTVVGNAVDQDVLRRAGITNADAFVAATSGDNRNIMASQVVREVFHVPKVIARIKDPIRAGIYAGMGYDVDCRTTEGAKILLHVVERCQDLDRGAD
jgi:trk system potassium uptake protein TrkA